MSIRRNRHAQLARTAGWGARGMALVCLVGVVVFPVYWMIVCSVTKGSIFVWPPRLVPPAVTLAPYRQVIEGKPVLLWFGNTAAVAIGTTLVSLLVAIPCGLSLSRFRTRANQSLGIVVLVTQMLPASLLAIPMYMLFARVGLLDNLAGLVVADTAFSVPLAVWMLKGFFDSIPPALEEAAMVDGCSRAAAFLRILVPLALPGIIAVAIFAFMTSWGELFFAQTLINSAGHWVLSVGLSSFEGEYTVDWAAMLAAATIFAIPPLALFLGLQRYLISGLTGGAVKG